ncbi:MAG: hypothetical protein HOE61_02230 [Candidatus Marinimicrobia bacterium]|jgi:hypothetical protein|nr:hypothetical protein [Candidatus Neomarinimicrobiota bacterium]
MIEYTYRQVKNLIERNPNMFDDVDTLNNKRAIVWLPSHMSVFNRFMEESLKARMAGYQRYSARGIWHYLRHLHQVSDQEHKYNLTNIVTPTLARIAMKLNPRLEGLFLLRCNGGRG